MLSELLTEVISPLLSLINNSTRSNDSRRCKFRDLKKKYFNGLNVTGVVYRLTLLQSRDKLHRLDGHIVLCIVYYSVNIMISKDCFSYPKINK